MIKNGACNLCSINLSEYVINPFTKEAFIDFPELAMDIMHIVEAMDSIIDENANNHALKKQKEMALKYRNIGIGIMGLADMFVKLGITYGDKDSIELTEQISKFIFRKAVEASAYLGILRGNFPEYDNKVWESSIMKNAFTEEELKALKENDSLRNCSLISVAPTGSIGTMLNISTGVEPFFMLQYQRNTKSLNNEEKSYTVNIKALDEYFKYTNTTEIPEYFISSNNINWKDRIGIQSALQKYTDTAISSTINLPKTTTPEEVEQIYLEAWKQGLKGITIYVDGSRDPILSKVGEKPKEVPNTRAPKRPKDLIADCYTIKSRGEQFIVMVGLLDNKPYEVFAYKVRSNVNIPNHQGTIIKIKKGHYTFKSNILNIDNIQLEMSNIEEKATTLYTSMLLRHGVSIEWIIKTIKKVNENIISFSSAICRVLAKYLDSKEILQEKCPECDNNLIREGGCISCPSCGYSKCG